MKKNLTFKFKIVLLSILVLTLGACTDNKGGKEWVDSKNSSENTEYLKESSSLKAVWWEDSNSWTTAESWVAYTGTLSDDDL